MSRGKTTSHSLSLAWFTFGANGSRRIVGHRLAAVLGVKTFGEAAALDCLFAAHDVVAADGALGLHLDVDFHR